MENEIVELNFDEAVKIFKVKQGEVLKNFVYGCIEL